MTGESELIGAGIRGPVGGGVFIKILAENPRPLPLPFTQPEIAELRQFIDAAFEDHPRSRVPRIAAEVGFPIPEIPVGPDLLHHFTTCDLGDTFRPRTANIAEKAGQTSSRRGSARVVVAICARGFRLIPAILKLSELAEGDVAIVRVWGEEGLMPVAHRV